MAGGMQVGQNTINAAQYTGNVGLQGASTLAQLLGAQGNAQAAGTMGSANAWSGALGGIGNAAQSYQQNQTLNNLFGGGGTASSAPAGFATATKPFSMYGSGNPYSFSTSAPAGLSSIPWSTAGATPTSAATGGY